MSIVLSLLLSQARVLPQVDRRALEQQARAEAVQSRRATSARAPRPQTASQSARLPASRRLAQRSAPPAVRRASGGTLDLAEVTSICRAASSQADAAAFLATLARVRSLSPAQGASLRIGCAAYQAGRSDAQVSRATPGL